MYSHPCLNWCLYCHTAVLQLEYLRSLGYLEKTHNRRRDEFVM
jgi:hypothetical protein